jgi:hypothetical protein
MWYTCRGERGETEADAVFDGENFRLENYGFSADAE